MIISGKEICQTYGTKILFDGLSFVVEQNDKIGILGVNGSGKTTFLKAIVGLTHLDKGIIYREPNLTISYLPQNPVFKDTLSFKEAVKEKCNKSPDYEIEAMLNRFGLTNYDKQVSGASGGELKRLALVISLLIKSDVLVLDEPTNHLDIWMIAYLENFLKKYTKTLILVTHDRYFLERVTDTIWEFDYHVLQVYNGNFKSYLQEKILRMNDKIANYRKMQSLLKKEAIWAALNPQARSTKSVERTARFNQLEQDTSTLNKMIHERDSKIQFSSSTSYLGKKVLEIDNLSMTIENKVLFKDFNYFMKRYDRVGIVGKNGCGKSTLFRLIIKDITPDTGTIVIGDTVKIGYFSQNALEMDNNELIIDYIKDFGEYVDTIDGRISASQLLENYLFPASLQHQLIKTLSGGEKRRLQLVALLIQSPNVLLLDEPTNDLDIETIEILENYLESFKGAVMVVSHDRYFLDKVCDHYLLFQNETIKDYQMSVEKLLANYTEEVIVKPVITKTLVNIPRFTSREKKEYDNMLDLIQKEEDDIASLDKEISLVTTDYQKLMKLNEEKKEKQEKLDETLKRYIYLDGINDAINEYRANKKA